jgi:hypothetical protein
MSALPKWKLDLADREANERLAQHRARPMIGARRLQAALQAALAPLIKAAGPSTGSLDAHWKEIVGERLAQMTRPLRLETSKAGATLHVRAPSAAAALLQHGESQILERVSLAAGVRVRRLKLVQTAADAPKPARKTRDLPEAERRAIAAAASGIRSPELRSALIALGEAIAQDERTLG